MNHLLQNIFHPHRIDFRVRNREEIVRYLHANNGNGKIFGLAKKDSSQIYFVSVSFLGQDERGDYVMLHWFDTSGTFISNITVFVNDIEAIFPLGNIPKAMSTIRKFIRQQIDVLIPQAA